MEFIKLQTGCLVVLLYTALVYLRGRKKYNGNQHKTFFVPLLILGILSVALDGATAYTVNNRDVVSSAVNTVLHALYLICLDSVIFALFLYMLDITGAMTKNKIYRVVFLAPFLINIGFVVFNIGSLEYVKGDTTYYSMGMPAYTCYIMAAIYTLLSLGVFFRRWNYIENNKRASIFTYLIVLICVTGIQMSFPEMLISSIAVTVFILGIYMNLEDPALRELSYYHTETVMSFANLIENRDNSTGGHIKRTSRYVEIIADGLLEHRCHTDILTKDYITNLLKAAPMHDIGKISVPDAILRKPGKLTDEEYAEMKKHSANGADIIQETFSNLGDDNFRKMACDVARFHHEKWNGNGYPEGIKGDSIPLCARIMAVADVFDAISEKRCYRDAMPMDKCFEIIEQGSGQDFDPLIVVVFMENRDKVEKVHSELAEEKLSCEQKN